MMFDIRHLDDKTNAERSSCWSVTVEHGLVNQDKEKMFDTWEEASNYVLSVLTESKMRGMKSILVGKDPQVYTDIYPGLSPGNWRCKTKPVRVIGREESHEASQIKLDGD